MTPTIISVLSKVNRRRPIMFQMLPNSLLKVNQRKKPTPHTEVTFATTEITADQVFRNEGKIGVIIWADKAELEKEYKKLQAQPPKEDSKTSKPRKR